jgi:hypothetical protein
VFIACGLIAWVPFVFGAQRWYWALLAHAAGVAVVIGLKLGRIHVRKRKATTEDPWSVWELLYEPRGHVELRLGTFEGRYSEAVDECQLRSLRWHWKRGDLNKGPIAGRPRVRPMQIREQSNGPRPAA